MGNIRLENVVGIFLIQMGYNINWVENCCFAEYLEIIYDRLSLIVELNEWFETLVDELCY